MIGSLIYLAAQYNALIFVCLTLSTPFIIFVAAFSYTEITLPEFLKQLPRLATKFLINILWDYDELFPVENDPNSTRIVINDEPTGTEM